MRPLLMIVGVLVAVGLTVGLARTTSATEVSDPIGDTFAPPGVEPLDISSMDAQFNATSLTITVNFATPIQPPSADAVNSAWAFIFLDTDQDAATGLNGDEFFVNVGAEVLTPGQAEVLDDQFAAVGHAPVSFAATSFVVTIPLSLIGDDDGLVDYFVLVSALDPGTGYTEITDEAPNEGAATSEAAPEPTPSPTPTPSQLPETGGQPAGGSGLSWVAVAMGALLAASAGGLVLVLRGRAKAV